jgi:hypothetical protein
MKHVGQDVWSGGKPGIIRAEGRVFRWRHSKCKDLRWETKEWGKEPW